MQGWEETEGKSYAILRKLFASPVQAPERLPPFPRGASPKKQGSMFWIYLYFGLLEVAEQ